MVNKLDKLLTLVLSFIFLILLVSAFRTNRTNHTKIITEPGLFQQTLVDAYPNLPVIPQTVPLKNDLFYQIQQGDSVACFDVQAQPALTHHLAKNWYPAALVTPLIAIDRSQTSVTITSWQDLTKADCPIGLAGPFNETQLILAAMAYGLEGENFTLDAVLNLLQQLDLNEGMLDSPIIICFDAQAIDLIKKTHRPLELVLPKEGTLSYQIGLLSNQELAPIPEKLLLNHDLRLLNGQTTNPNYPAPADYQRAMSYPSNAYLLRQMKRSGAKIRRLVHHNRLYSAADDKENILFAMVTIIITLIWLEYALYRAINPSIKRAIYALAFTIISWILLRMFKYQLNSLTTLVRYCWYGYYLFQLALPLIMLYVADSITQFEPKKQISKWSYPFYLCYPILVGLVFTNDWHRLVFQFDINGNWSDVYQYQIVYYLIYAFCGTTLFLAIYLLIKKSKYNPNRYAHLLPLGFGLLMMFYSLAYIKGFDFARKSDITITQCVFALIFFEITLQTGLVPTNTHYRELFANAPLNMKIADQKAHIFVKSLEASQLSLTEKYLLTTKQTAAMIKQDTNTLVFSHKIAGGTILWQEKITQLNQLQNEIDMAIQQLKATNELLFKQKEIYRQKIGQQLTSELFTLLEEQMEEKRLSLVEAIEQLEQASQNDVTAETTSAEQIDNTITKTTKLITLLLCNIKRRCNLFFIQQDTTMISKQELEIYLNELNQFVQSDYYHCHLDLYLPDELAITDAICLYDYYFSVLTWGLTHEPLTLLSHIHYQDQTYQFSILSSQAADDFCLPDSLIEGLTKHQGHFTLEQIDDLSRFILHLRGKGVDSHD